MNTSEERFSTFEEKNLMRHLTINEAQDFLAKNPKIHTVIKNLMNESIDGKIPRFYKSSKSEFYSLLITCDLVQEAGEDKFEINYEMLTAGLVQMEIAESKLAKPFPTEVFAVLEFADRFFEEVKQPQKNNLWYGGKFELEFKKFVLIYLNQVNSVDVTGFLHSLDEDIQKRERVTHSFEHHYVDAFPYLTDSVEVSLKTVKHFFDNTNTVYYAREMLQGLGKLNPVKATSLYDLSKKEGATNYVRFLSYLLIGLSESDPEKAFERAKTLFDENPVEGLIALTYFKYQDNLKLNTAFDLIGSCNNSTEEYLIGLCAFYADAIQNLNSSNELRKKAFDKIFELAQMQNEGIKDSLANNVRSIKGFDAEKFDLLTFLFTPARPYIIRDYFTYFDNPAFLFKLLKDSFITHGNNVRFELFSEALISAQHSHPARFEEELLDLLSNDLSILRFAGVKVLLSNSGRAYPVDFLKLDEERQERIIISLLPQPTSIEKLLPLVLQLRKSPYETIRLKLNEELVKLIWAFDKHLVDLLEKNLIPHDPDDKLILSLVSSVLERYLNEKEVKLKMKEFNPAENELEYMETYFRLEHEKQTELMEEAQHKSIFNQIARTISVIRGNAFTTESNPKISPMATVGVSQLMDQRYYMNPDAYEYNFRETIYNRNYKPQKSK